MRLEKNISFNMILPLYGFSKYRNWKIKGVFQEMAMIQTWPREEIEKYQLGKLRSLLTHAQNRVSFYKKRFEPLNFSASSLENIAQLSTLPSLTRSDIQRHPIEDMMALNYDISSCYHGSSSGSTGQPVHYYRDMDCVMKSDAAAFLGQVIIGWNFGKNKLLVWGNPTTVHKDWQRIRSRVKSACFRETRVPAYLLQSKGKMLELVDLLKKNKYQIIAGYTSAIFSLAKFIKEENFVIQKLERVLTTAETLQPHQQKTIEEVLGPVRDYYGCGEINSIAYQCGHNQGGYHVIDPHVIVEYGDIVDDSGNHELLITDLDNYAMPLIRYANGDKGKPGQGLCDCGNNFSVMKDVSGRISDVIKTPDGGILAVPSFVGSLKEMTGIERYQVELIRNDLFYVNVEVNELFVKSQRAKFVKALNGYIPKSFQWELHVVDEILPDKSGKFKLVIDRTS